MKLKGELWFSIDIGYTKKYNELKALAARPPVSNGNNTYNWMFPIKNLKKIEEIVDKIDLYGANIIERTVGTNVEVPEWKGIDEIEIIQKPDHFIIIEHRKDEDGEVKDIRHELSMENVNAMWNVIKENPKFIKYKSSVIAKNIVKSKGITKYNDNNGQFSFATFFGTRKDYYSIFYLPCKVLAFYKIINHHRGGSIERISDTWEVKS